LHMRDRKNSTRGSEKKNKAVQEKEDARKAPRNQDLLGREKASCRKDGKGVGWGKASMGPNLQTLTLRLCGKT